MRPPASGTAKLTQKRAKKPRLKEVAGVTQAAPGPKEAPACEASPLPQPPPAAAAHPESSNFSTVCKGTEGKGKAGGGAPPPEITLSSASCPPLCKDKKERDAVSSSSPPRPPPPLEDLFEPAGMPPSAPRPENTFGSAGFCTGSSVTILPPDVPVRVSDAKARGVVESASADGKLEATGYQERSIPPIDSAPGARVPLVQGPCRSGRERRGGGGGDGCSSCECVDARFPLILNSTPTPPSPPPVPLNKREATSGASNLTAR